MSKLQFPEGIDSREYSAMDFTDTNLCGVGSSIGRDVFSCLCMRCEGCYLNFDNREQLLEELAKDPSKHLNIRKALKLPDAIESVKPFSMIGADKIQELEVEGVTYKVPIIERIRTVSFGKLENTDVEAENYCAHVKLGSCKAVLCKTCVLCSSIFSIDKFRSLIETNPAYADLKPLLTPRDIPKPIEVSSIKTFKFPEGIEDFVGIEYSAGSICYGATKCAAFSCDECFTHGENRAELLAYLEKDTTPKYNNLRGILGLPLVKGLSDFSTIAEKSCTIVDDATPEERLARRDPKVCGRDAIVLCETQEQWDFIVSDLDIIFHQAKWATYKEFSYIGIFDTLAGDSKAVVSKITSFNDWLHTKPKHTGLPSNSIEITTTPTTPTGELLSSLRKVKLLCNSFGYYAGDIGYIIRDSGTGSCVVYVPGRTSFSFDYAPYVRVSNVNLGFLETKHATTTAVSALESTTTTKEVTPKFKVGDKVKIIGNSCGHYFTKGSEKVITHIYHKDGPRICFVDNSPSGYYTRERDLELILEEPESLEDYKPVSKFKVGDRVRIVKDTCHHEYMLGTVRCITYINSKESPIEYCFVDGSAKGNYAVAEDLELVISSEEIEKPKSLGKKEGVDLKEEDGFLLFDI